MARPQSILIWPIVAIFLSLLLVACSTSEETAPQPQAEERETIWDLFSGRSDPSLTHNVNRYLWNSSLEVLNFLPLKSADPFTGVIITEWGRAPGTNVEYQATVKIPDPALAPRSLKLSLNTRSGLASVETIRAVEDAIFTRARQLRQADEGL